ncbi:TDP-N-acetylfucosamine:lipid II N-acetylfucosaminyltransferase [Psychrobacter frigidicola]|uniref:TDP-N-acetylfucosamine:lipid II N-acetylfucosaminyltransferase n=1 Tax=Psychrobacter frigidicola TaxID=45611 RepID=UPI00191A4104|nr:TDP-N-acetylfucosamine:lipid II N-acetylfucosaminyltransferase [Psychrobacter frigidicola]
MSKQILHIASSEKFIPPFINFVKENFNFDEHEFSLTRGMAQDNLIHGKNIKLLSEKTSSAKLKHYIQVLVRMHQADKIILHSLADHTIIKILFFTPWLLKKCYWAIWGGDLYVYRFGKRNHKWRVREFFRRSVIKKMGHLVTYIKGDIDLAREWYGAQGEYYECIMYLSNIYKELDISKNDSSTINIQLGNSANSTNNHVEILEKLLPFKNKNIRIYAPLSYSDQSHAKKVIKIGKELFGDKFVPLTEFMPFEDYLKFLEKIDIAIFNNSRQQALGNIITLLGLGKTVYIRSDTTQWPLFKAKEIEIYDVKDFNSLVNHHHPDNIDKIKKYFSKETLLNQLSELF